MKTPAIYCYALLLIFLCRCSGHIKKESVKAGHKSDSHAVVVKDELENEGDTAYKIDDMLFAVPASMKIDIIRKDDKPVRLQSKGDTLFMDRNYTLLGDVKGLHGVYEKYNHPPDFAMYKVNRLYKGKLAMPDFSTDAEAKEFHTTITNECKDEGINFAGHYTIVQWGCGSDCLERAIVDRISGRIYFTNLFPVINPSDYYEFKPDSRLLLVNGEQEDSTYPGYYLYYDKKPGLFEWINGEFVGR